MSQHDMDIANQAGAAFRADLNNALLALVGNNSGATAPATTFAYMPWADTANDLLKQRNAANTAWISVMKLSTGEIVNKTFTGLVNHASGADIASAATVDLTAATGNTVTITGTTATSALTMNDGQHMTLVAAGAWPLTHNATTCNIVGGVNFTCAAGARLSAFKTGGVVYVLPHVGTSQFGSSMASSGYQKLPSGLIIQWGGLTNSASADTAVTFPVAFPTAVLSVVNTANVGGGSSIVATVNGASVTGFNSSTFNSNTTARTATPSLWMAVGN